jgi:hypothetical protein
MMLTFSTQIKSKWHRNEKLLRPQNGGCTIILQM